MFSAREIPTLAPAHADRDSLRVGLVVAAAALPLVLALAVMLAAR